MASVQEVKAQLAEANLKAGEALGALMEARTKMQGALATIQAAQEQVGAAVNVLIDAKNLAGAAFDGSGHPNAEFAWASFNEAEQYAISLHIHMRDEAEERTRACIVMSENQVEDKILAGQNSAELYIGTM